jgi:hypothetical protein
MVFPFSVALLPYRCSPPFGRRVAGDGVPREPDRASRTRQSTSRAAAVVRDEDFLHELCLGCAQV